MVFRQLWKRENSPEVTFATSCWEGDYPYLLTDPHYIEKKQTSPHLFSFSEKILVINNVENLPKIKELAEKRKEEGVITDYYSSKEYEKEVLSFFSLKKGDFTGEGKALPTWVYYNALAPLTALYFCKTPYFLYQTGDSRMEKGVEWIKKAISLLEKNENYKVANLLWNGKKKEAKKESYRSKRSFWVAKQGFSDQQFLVKTEDFRQPIYKEVSEDSSHYPRGDVWERRVFTHMKKKKWERLIYKKGSYIHENF